MVPIQGIPAFNPASGVHTKPSFVVILVRFKLEAGRKPRLRLRRFNKNKYGTESKNLEKHKGSAAFYPRLLTLFGRQILLLIPSG